MRYWVVIVERKRKRVCLVPETIQTSRLHMAGNQQGGDVVGMQNKTIPVNRRSKKEKNTITSYVEEVKGGEL